MCKPSMLALRVSMTPGRWSAATPNSSSLRELFQPRKCRMASHHRRHEFQRIGAHDGKRRECRAYKCNSPSGQGSDPRQAPGVAADQQSRRHADHAGAGSEQLGDRDGRQALRAAGEEREPTYDEIVDAKLDLVRNLAPAASGVLIDAYYGAWSAIASEAIPPDKGLLVRYEMSGSPKNKVGAPLAAVEPGWSVEKIKLMGADAVKLLAQFEPTEPELGRASVPACRARVRRMQEVRYPAASGDVFLPLRRREEDQPQLPEAEGADGHRVGPAAQPVLRHLQDRVPRHDGRGAGRSAPRTTSARSTRSASGPGCCFRQGLITSTT